LDHLQSRRRCDPHCGHEGVAMTMHWRKINSVTGATPPSRLDSLDLGRGPFTQAALDTISVLFAVMFVLALVGSLPLAVFLMLFASF
jgi:hypothetical protein